MAAKKRKKYTQAFKEKAVARVVRAGRPRKGVSLISEARMLGIADSVLRIWVRTPSLGGSPGLFKGKTCKKKVLKNLPTEKVTPRRAKDVVPTAYACPHCRGPLLLPK